MKRIRKAISLWLALCLVVSMVPVPVFAEETTEMITATEEFSVKEEAMNAEAATSGSCGENLTWDLTDGVLTISGSGPMTVFSTYSGIPWYGFRKDILEVVIHDGVTSLCNYAFYRCDAMVSADIPDSVTEIGYYAFGDCTSLKQVTLPEGLTKISHDTFILCSQLASVTIPASVTVIEAGAFNSCQALTDIRIPKGVTAIESGTFEGCISLTALVLPEGVTKIGDRAFQNCSNLQSISIPATVAEIGDYVFYYCTSLRSAEIPEGVTSVGEYTFAECSALQSIAIADSVTSIGPGAFSGCTMLGYVELPGSLVRIRDWAFSNCISMKVLEIPNGVTAIGNYAFSNCTNLMQITFQGNAPAFSENKPFSGVTATVYYPANNETWTADIMQDYGGTLTWEPIEGTGHAHNYVNNVCTICGAVRSDGEISWTFDNGVLTISGTGAMPDYTQTTMPWAAHKNETTSIVIEGDITSVGSWAFCNFSKVQSVTLPSTLKTIGTYAFYNCGKLAELSIPAVVTAIEDYAFSGCYSLTGTLVIPGSVATVGSYAFSECSGLQNIVLSSGVKTLGEGAFSDCDSVRYVTVSESVESIGTFAFGDCGGLLEINVVTANPYYTSDSGVLFTKDKKTLIQYPAGYGGVYYVPESVTAVESHAFRGCSNIQEVVFQAAAPSFGQYAFYNTAATVRYPLGEESWTSGVQQNYGGTLTWRASDVREAVPAGEISGDFEYHSNLTGDDETYSFTYDDNWFLRSLENYSQDLARISIRLATAAARTTKGSVEKLYKTLGFSQITTHYPNPPTSETIGYSIASKKVLDANNTEYTIIAVAVRGGGYGAEWADNLRLGTGNEHAGFAGAANTVTAAIREYLDKIGTDLNVKLWITGFSRAAATSNLTAHRLNVAAKNGELPGITTKDICAYCFECPSGVLATKANTQGRDMNIFNIINSMDLVPMVAPAIWNYGRYGIDYYIPSPEINYKGFASAFARMQKEYTKILDEAGHQYPDVYVTDVTSYMRAQHSEYTNLIEAVATSIRSGADYVQKHQSTVMSLLSKLNGGDDELDLGGILELLADGAPELFGFHLDELLKLIGGGKYIGRTHYPELCMAWMDSLAEGELQNTLDKNIQTRYLFVMCPVDVEVYDSTGKLVAQILNDEVQDIPGSTIGAMFDRNGQKVICLPMDEEFDIRVTATDGGAVSCLIQEQNMVTGEVTRLVEYRDVAIETGDVLEGFAGEHTGSATEYTLTDPDRKTLSPTKDLTGEEVSSFLVTVQVEGSGTVSGGGSYIQGEYAQVTAKEGHFLGWYADGKQVSSDTSYRFRVEEDIQLTAKFEEKPRSVPMFRMYDPNSGEHFYSGAELERDFLVEAGWHYEGVGFNFPEEGAPVHRLYDPVHGEHLYTMDEAEMNKLLAEGWNYEGVAFNSAGSGEVPQYRLHNPNAKRGGYHFTGSEVERDLLISLGWIPQGIGWYSCVD